MERLEIVFGFWAAEVLVYSPPPMLPHLYPRRRVPTLLLAAGCVLAVVFPERTAAQGDLLLVNVSVMQEERRKGSRIKRL